MAPTLQSRLMLRFIGPSEPRRCPTDGTIGADKYQKRQASSPNLHVETRVITVAIGAGALEEPGSDRGLGRYARALIAAAGSLPQVETRLVQSASTHDEKAWARAQPSLLSELNKVDVYHATGPDQLPAIKTVPWVCSVLDTIPLDLPTRSGMGIKTRWVHKRIRKCEFVIALSEFTKERIINLIEVDPAKICVAPLPILPMSAIEGLNTPPNGYKYVAALVDGRTSDPRKRNHWVDQLAAELNEHGVQVRVAGRGIDPSQYSNCIVESEMTDSELARFFHDASLFFYPSAYEGQGLPPLEAMAMGTPVLAFRNSAIGQMVGVDEFLISDPIPWQEHRLEDPMPRSGLDEVVTRIMSMIANPQHAQYFAALAMRRSDELGVNLMPAALDYAYRGAVTSPISTGGEQKL